MSNLYTESNKLISMHDIHKRFPGVYALKGVNIDIHAGSVHALVGENGAGKSTLIKIISGAYSDFKGSYKINNIPAQIHHPGDAIKKGISVIYQELNLVQEISIAENIFFGQLPHSKSGRVYWNKLKSDSRAVLDKVGLTVNPMLQVRHLPIAQQQLVEIAKALSHNAKVIIMDEPTSALSPKEVNRLFDIIKNLQKDGVAILYISHKLDEIFTIADCVTVLRDGSLIGWYPANTLNQAKLISLMVGRNLEDLFPKNRLVKGDVVLKVKGLTTEKVRDISFHVREGEIVGFSGLMGSGRSELAYALIGSDKRLDGSIHVGSEQIPLNSPFKARTLGLGLIPEDRKQDGIFTNLDVQRNISIVSLKSLMRFFTINGYKERQIVGDYVSKLSVKTPTLNQLISKLSGGNQQKAIIARWLMNQNLKVLIIDEPTRGIDVGAKFEIYTLMNNMAQNGLAIVMMSSELPEILGMCDRIYVLKNGRIAGDFSKNEATEQLLLSKAIHN